MAEILEILMLVSFGFSWPLNVIKSYKARTTKGKSLPFLCLIIAGYLCGIASKIVAEKPVVWYVMFFYVLNCLMVSVDLVMYFRNLRLDKQAKGLVS